MQATFSSAFLRGDPQAAPFLPADFRDGAARRRLAQKAAARARPRSIDARLLDELGAQERELGIKKSATRTRHLEALGRAGTAVVVSGQQVGLFLGPLYGFYKAASAIAVARTIERESNVPCVPIFWLQTEDHDYPEINSCHVPGAGGLPLRLALPKGADDEARISIAHRQLGPEVLALHDELTETLGQMPHAAEFLALLREHYRPGASLGAAFAGVLAELFSDEGLLIIDPRRAAVATLAAPIYRRALEQQEAIAAALLERSSALREAGFEEQVHVRPSASLVFLHEQSATGPRYRLERHQRGWMMKNHAGLISDAELLAILERDPLRFSTSALLRPMVQDSILPTVAYVGGPGELNYWAQLAPLYSLLQIAQPLCVPRARFRCLEPRTRDLLAKLCLDVGEVEAPRPDVLRKLLLRTAPQKLDPESLRSRLLCDLAQRLSEVTALEPTLCDAVRKTRASIERNVERLVGRYSHNFVERDRVVSERLDRLRGYLYPDEMPQERFFGIPYFACKLGAQTFKNKVLHGLEADGPFLTGARNLEL